LGGVLTDMTWDLYAAYLVATIIVLTIPGPTVMLVVSYALAEGRRSAWATVVGVAAGDLTAMTLSLAGMGAILSASADLFTVLKWIGAGYLIYLGIKLWRALPTLDAPAPGATQRSATAMMGHAFAVTALNPKSILFFVAFLPQFIRAGAPVTPQLVLLGITFLVLAVVNAAAYAMLTGGIRDNVRKPSVLKTINRVGGGVLIGAGILTAALKRSS
jgi:threonine/homoserine/homoserine lactone efflux protein